MTRVRTPSPTGRLLFAVVVASTAVAITLGTGTAVGQGLSIDNAGSYGAEIGNLFCTNISISGEVGDVQVTTSGTLPPGISVSSHLFGALPAAQETRWALRGEPAALGDFSFSVTATDDMGTPATGDDQAVTETFAVSVVAESATDFVIATGRLGVGYAIDCNSQGRETQGFLRSLDDFGPGGTVDQRLAVREWTGWDAAANGGAGAGIPITADYLDGVDVLLDGWVQNGTWAPAELTLIEDWVNAGGVLIAAEDHEDADAVGELFGAPTNSQALCPHTPSEVGDPNVICPLVSPVGIGPVVDGPFGDWTGSTVRTGGTVGNYSSVPSDWEVVARSDRVGTPAVVITKPVGLGRVILLADETLWRTESFPTAANRTFVGNLIAYAIGAEGGGDDGGGGGGGTPIPPAPTCDGVTATIVGGPNKRVINGTAGRDVIATRNPDGVRIDGRGGNDLICGGRGADTILGGNGRDLLRGGGGADTLRGGGSRDRCVGGTGRDRADRTCETRRSIARVIPRH